MEDPLLSFKGSLCNCSIIFDYESGSENSDQDFVDAPDSAGICSKRCVDKLQLTLQLDQLQIQALIVILPYTFNQDLCGDTYQRQTYSDINALDRQTREDNWEMFCLFMNFPYSGQQTWQFRNSSERSKISLILTNSLWLYPTGEFTNW